MQQGQYVGKIIKHDLQYRPRHPFRYRDKGMMATIGRGRAVVHGKGLPTMTGMLAWLTWSLVHILYLVGFHNRIIVMFEWLWSFFTFGRGERLIATPFEERTRWGRSAASLATSIRAPSPQAPPDAKDQT